MIRICPMCNGRGKRPYGDVLDTCDGCAGTGDSSRLRGGCEHRMHAVDGGLVCVVCRLSVSGEELSAFGWVRA